jgi:DNA adenine methylase
MSPADLSPRRYVSPLRYPGGKATMAPWLATMFAGQRALMDVEVWIEPFAGGAGAALTLIDRDAVDEAWIVDANPGIAAFWRTVVSEGDALASLVERTQPTLALYDASRQLLSEASTADEFKLAYAAFVVNRCSRSGIVAPTSGPIGGRAADGRHTVADRFNSVVLAERIRHVASFGSRLRVTRGDGIAFLEDVAGSGVEDEVLFFVDPPYLREGNRLYANGMGESDHVRLAAALNSTPAKWVLTYDDEPMVPDVLYPDRRVLAYDIRNTANRARIAREYAVFSDNLDLGADVALLPNGRTNWLRKTA